MKIIQFRIICIASLIALLTVAGCVAPPEASTTGPVDLYDPNQFKTETTGGAGTSRFVTEATPFMTPPPTTLGYSVIASQTLPPEDAACLFNLIPVSWKFEANKTAFAFDLVNPPMYINYSITKPFNITQTKLVTDKNGKETLLKYERPNPAAYMVITIRDRDTGDILMQDGYGQKYSYFTNNTDMKLMKGGNLLVEVSGYNVTGAVGFWAKPSGNFPADETFKGVECVHWVRAMQI